MEDSIARPARFEERFSVYRNHPDFANVNLDTGAPDDGTSELPIEQNDQPPQPFRTKPRFYHPLIALAMLTTTNFLGAYNTTSTVTTLPYIRVEGSSVQGFWIALSYLLANAVFQPLVATLSTILGRGRTLLGSILLIILGSIVAPTGRNLAAVTAGRAIQGIGSAGCSALAIVLPAETFPLNKQMLYIGVIEGGQAFGFVFGALLGAVLAQHASWRWIFYFNLPFCGLALITIPVALGLGGTGFRIQYSLQKLDLGGTFLLVISLTLFMIALIWGGIMFAWVSALTLLLLILGIVGLVILGVWEYTGAEEPFMRHRLFFRLTRKATYFCTFAQGFVLVPQLYFVSLYLSSAHGLSATPTSSILLALLIPIIPSFILCAILTKTLPNRTFSIWISLAFLILGTGLLLLLSLTTSPSICVPLLILLGVAHGATIYALDFAIQDSANNADIVHVALISAFLRSLGMALGLACSASVFLNLMQAELKRVGQPNALAEHALELILDLDRIPDAWPTKKLILGAYVRGCKGVFALLTAVAGAAFVVSAGIRIKPDTLLAELAARANSIGVAGASVVGSQKKSMWGCGRLANMWGGAGKSKGVHVDKEFPPAPVTIAGPEYRRQPELQHVVPPKTIELRDLPAAGAATTSQPLDDAVPRRRELPARDPAIKIVRNTSWFLTPHAVMWEDGAPPIPERKRGPLSP